jgi:hypothetical protein
MRSINNGWQPTPVQPPTVHPEFTKMSALERAAEALRYTIFCCEIWISPSGGMREWLRHDLRLGICLFIPVSLVVPVISVLLEQVTSWVSMLTTIFSRLIMLPVLVLLVLVVIRIVAAIITKR